MAKKYREAEERIHLNSGDVVKIAREMLGLTQVQLAKKTGISASHISDIEANRIDMGRKRALLLASALRIPAPYIMFPTSDFYRSKKVA